MYVFKEEGVRNKRNTEKRIVHDLDFLRLD